MRTETVSMAAEPTRPSSAFRQAWAATSRCAGRAHRYHPSAHPGATYERRRHACSPNDASVSPPLLFARPWDDLSPKGRGARVGAVAWQEGSVQTATGHQAAYE